ncbi:MAG: hypothetical protein WCO56_29540 [Verrucomicrobiota bacterium]
MKRENLPVEFANAGSPNTAEMVVECANEVGAGEDGWAQVARFGDYPGKAMIPGTNGTWEKQAAIQRFDAAAATEMVNEYARDRKGLTRFLRSRPVFQGHPDVPVGGEAYPNKAPIGVFPDLQVRPDGLYANLVLTAAGEELVATKAVRGPSTRWAVAYVGTENGVRVYRPNKLFSIGLVPNPNLPVQMLNAAEAGETKKQTRMNETLKRALLALFNSSGIEVANEATDEQFETALTSLATKVTAAMAQFANEKATLDGKVLALETEKAALVTERDAARTQFANERTARIGTVIGAALTRMAGSRRRRRRTGNGALPMNRSSPMRRRAWRSWRRR